MHRLASIFKPAARSDLDSAAAAPGLRKSDEQSPSASAANRIGASRTRRGAAVSRQPVASRDS